MLLPLLLLLTLAIPGVAMAHHGKDYGKTRKRPKPAYDETRVGFLVVENPNLEKLILKLDGRQIGKVGAGERARFGPFSEGEHKLVSRLADGDRHLQVTLTKEEIFIDRRMPARVILPAFPMVVLDLENTWVEDMRVRINGTERGEVEARSVLSLAARSPAKVEFLNSRGRAVSSERVTGRRLQTVPVALVAPSRASVQVYNPSSVVLQLTNGRGRDLGAIGPQSSRVLSLRSGHRTLIALRGDRRIDSTKLLADPFQGNDWTIRLPRRAAVTIRNLEPGPAALFIDGTHIGTVGGRETAVFDLPVGELVLEARIRDHRRTRRTRRLVQVDPFDGATLRILAGAVGRRGGKRHSSYWHNSWDRQDWGFSYSGTGSRGYTSHASRENQDYSSMAKRGHGRSCGR